MPEGGGPSASRFPRVGRFARGYDPRQVDPFLAAVESALPDAAPREGAPGGPAGGAASMMSAGDIRRAGFRLVRGGYRVAEVDGHLDELERRAHERASDPADREDLARTLAALLRRLSGPPGGSFPRASRLRRGYRVCEVDDFLAELRVGLLDDGERAASMEVGAVRAAVFHGRHGGYEEGAVDDALDAVVDLLLRRQRAAKAPPREAPAAAR